MAAAQPADIDLMGSVAAPGALLLSADSRLAAVTLEAVYILAIPAVEGRRWWALPLAAGMAWGDGRLGVAAPAPRKRAAASAFALKSAGTSKKAKAAREAVRFRSAAWSPVGAAGCMLACCAADGSVVVYGEVPADGAESLPELPAALDVTALVLEHLAGTSYRLDAAQPPAARCREADGAAGGHLAPAFAEGAKERRPHLWDDEADEFVRRKELATARSIAWSPVLSGAGAPHSVLAVGTLSALVLLRRGHGAPGGSAAGAEAGAELEVAAAAGLPADMAQLGAVEWLASAPDSARPRLATGSCTGSVWVWEMKRGRTTSLAPVLRVLPPGAGPVTLLSAPPRFEAGELASPVLAIARGGRVLVWEIGGREIGGSAADHGGCRSFECGALGAGGLVWRKGQAPAARPSLLLAGLDGGLGTLAADAQGELQKAQAPVLAAGAPGRSAPLHGVAALASGSQVIVLAKLQIAAKAPDLFRKSFKCRLATLADK